MIVVVVFVRGVVFVSVAVGVVGVKDGADAEKVGVGAVGTKVGAEGERVRVSIVVVVLVVVDEGLWCFSSRRHLRLACRTSCRRRISWRRVVFVSLSLLLFVLLLLFLLL